MKPLRTLVAGMTHGHVNWLLHRDPALNDLEIVGWQESDEHHLRELAEKHSLRRTFTDLKEALSATRPEAILGFGAIDEHLSVVEAAAAHGIPVILEKPLAPSLQEALAIDRLARESGTPVYVNYETSHYPALSEAFLRFCEGELGTLRRLEFWTGHQGPSARGAKPEFLQWLHQSKRGGGALLDFGCYGAAISTQWHGGALPDAVFATTQNNAEAIHPHAESDATILLTYPHSQTVIHASWTWPYSRKEMSASGTKARIAQLDARKLELTGEESKRAWESAGPMPDGFTKFAETLRGLRPPEENHPFSLENAVAVAKILEAAKQSAHSGSSVDPAGLKPPPGGQTPI